MRYMYIFLAAIVVIFAGCHSRPHKPEGPTSITNVEPAKHLPAFAKQQNEVEIADSMNDVDPSWVLGSIVNISTGRVRGLDNYLSPNAKPLVTPQTEVIFKDIIENSLAVNSSWLVFLRASLSDKVRAELSVIKTSKVTMKNEDVDKKKLTNELQRIRPQDRENYGVIIGYIDFVLSASLLKDFGTDAGASGYGAKIGGKWFSKFENTSAHHRVVAIWSPLPFVVESVSSRTPTSDLEKELQEAINKGVVRIDRRIDHQFEFEAYLRDKKM